MIIKFLVDLLLWTLATPMALFLRLEGLPPQYWDFLWTYSLLSLPIQALLIALFGLHHQAWSRVGVRDLVRLALGVGLGGGMLLAFTLVLNNFLPLPRSVPLISSILAFLAMGGVRLGVRLYWERGKGLRVGHARRRVLIVGAGEAGSMVAREMLRHPEAGLYPVGFLDDDPNKRGQTIAGVRVVGALDDLPRAVRALEVDEVLVAIPSAPGSVVRKVVELARAVGVSYRILPGIHEILSGRVQLSQIREVRLEDLLRREPVPWYEHREVGYNYRMSNLLAAVGRAQLRTLEERVQARRRIYQRYVEGLVDLPGIAFQPEAPWGRHTRWLTVMTIEPELFGATVEEVRRALEVENIEARPVWKPLHLQPVFRDCEKIGGAVAESLFPKGLCLPCGSSLTESDQARIIEIVKSLCKSI